MIAPARYSLFVQTVAVLMKSKEGATDLGKAERCILQPQLARKMARMSTAKRTDFEKQVELAVEQIVYAAKRRYVRRQEMLDEAGVFHPEANAHRSVLFGRPWRISQDSNNVASFRKRRIG